MSTAIRLRAGHAARPVPAESPDMADWLRHRRVLLRMPAEEVGFRGAAALALKTAAEADGAGWVVVGGRALVPDADLTWLSITDIPRPHWATAADREVHLARAHRTTVRHGVPAIGPSLFQYDFRRVPGEPGSRLDLADGPEVFHAQEHPGLFPLFNALEWALTSSACVFRRSWAALRDELAEIAGPGHPLASGSRFQAPLPRSWMPVPHVGFRAGLLGHGLFEACCHLGAGDDTVVPDGVKALFCADAERGFPVVAPFAGRLDRIESPRGDAQRCSTLRLRSHDGATALIAVDPHFVSLLDRNADRRPPFEAGQEIAAERPGVRPRPGRLADRWRDALRLFRGRSPEDVLRTWFSRQPVSVVPGLVHLRLPLADAALPLRAADAPLYWDLYPCMRHYDEGLAAFVFPPIPLGYWDRFRFDLDGVVDVDLTPAPLA